MRVMNWVGLATLIGLLALLPPSASAQEDANPCPAPTIVGIDDDDHIVGTEGADVIDALGGDDVVEGLGGDDLICGGDGGDSLVGGAGNDRLYGQGYVLVVGMEAVIVWRPNIMNGGAGDDYFSTSTSDSGASYGGNFMTFEDAAQGVEVDLDSGLATGDGTDTFGSSRWNVVGSAYADDLAGDNTGNVLVGGEGDDVLKGGDGIDHLRDDQSNYGFGPELSVVGGGVDVMSGGPGEDSVQGGDGDDDVSGGAGDLDYVYGEDGNDTVSGGGGDDDYVSGGMATTRSLAGEAMTSCGVTAFRVPNSAMTTCVAVAEMTASEGAAARTWSRVALATTRFWSGPPWARDRGGRGRRGERRSWRGCPQRWAWR